MFSRLTTSKRLKQLTIPLNSHHRHLTTISSRHCTPTITPTKSCFQTQKPTPKTLAASPHSHTQFYPHQHPNPLNPPRRFFSTQRGPTEGSKPKPNVTCEQQTDRTKTLSDTQIINPGISRRTGDTSSSFMAKITKGLQGYNHFLPIIPSTLMGFTLFPQRPSPFDDPTDDITTNDYNPNDIHLDFSETRTRRYRLASDGTEVEISADNNNEPAYNVREIIDEEVLQRINQVVDDVIGGIESVHTSSDHPSSNSPSSSSSSSGIDTKSSGGDLFDYDDRLLTEEEKLIKESGDKIALALSEIIVQKRKHVLSYMSKLSRPVITRYLEIRSSMVAKLKSKADDFISYWFPSDVLDVIDLSLDQMIRIVHYSVALIKGYSIGALAALCLRVSLLEYTKLCFHFAFYPYLAFYIISTSYMMTNFIHIGAVLVAEFPIIKEFLMLAVQVHKLSTAPAYIVARVVFKFARELLKAHDKQLADEEEKKNEQEAKKVEQEKKKAERDAKKKTAQEKTAAALKSGGGGDSGDHNSQDVTSPTDSSYRDFPSFRSDGTLDDEYYGDDDGNDDSDSKETNFIDEISSALSLDHFKSPTDILSELHSSLGRINEDADIAVQHATSSSSSLFPLLSPLSQSGGNHSGGETSHLDIFVDEYVSIKQDLSNDTTLLEVTSIAPTGSNITITTSKSSIVLHA